MQQTTYVCASIVTANNYVYSVVSIRFYITYNEITKKFDSIFLIINGIISIYQVHRLVYTIQEIPRNQQDKNRHGAEEARRAHNPEDVRSKLTAGIISIYQVHHLVYTIQEIQEKPSRYSSAAERLKHRLLSL